jgi:polyisoprenoid-binding protein YceI
MNRTVRIVIGLVVVAVLVGAVVLAYILISGGSGEATQETISADVQPTTDEARVFRIAAAESEVRFLLDEDLRGQRVTVVGATRDVDGQIAVDFSAPGNSTLGEITINVRTLRTDNNFRDSAIRGQILLSSQDQYQFARFVPTRISGLPESVTFGEAFTFTVTGDFTLRDLTRPVTFEVTVTPESDARLVGSAKAVINRADFNLTIPSVPGVANVEEEVELEIDFVALPFTPSAEVTAPAATPEAAGA